MSDPNRKAERVARNAAKIDAYHETTKGLEFQGWPKISRLNRDIVITEKLDGTNAAIGIVEGELSTRVYAQSRSRIITPDEDNMGFARWVERNREELIRALGVGLHFGEWWGLGIQRGYDLSERRFSLFNTEKWNDPSVVALLETARMNGVAIYTVPVLYAGPWTGNYGYIDGPTGMWLDVDKQEGWPEVVGTANPRPRFAPTFILEWLKRTGSHAVPGYMKPEGICVYHKASGDIFKATIEGDEKHKFEV